MSDPFIKPIRASNHCRHYIYERAARWEDSGPRCAAGIDLGTPGSTGMCMPEPRGEACASRAEYTDAERAAWRASVDEGMARLGVAVKALPHPIPLNTSGAIECPNCGGRLSYARWHRGAEIACETENCCGARFNIAAGADWPEVRHV